jgi:hypothetical protein
MTAAPRFLSRLLLEAGEREGSAWTVRAPFIFESLVLDRTVTVPEGFATDLASVPRLPLVYLATGATGNEAAVIHDYLYETRAASRAKCDEVFREAAICSGMPRWRAWLMWAGIRAGGGFHWKDKGDNLGVP